MLETKTTSSSDEKDAVYYWNGSSSSAPVKVWDSSSELEVEDPPLDGKGGFYFVNVSSDFTRSADKMVSSDMTLLHGTINGLDSTLSYDLGEFRAPLSTFSMKNSDGNAGVAGMFPFVENISTGGSGSGCNAGSSVIALAFVGMLIFKKRS